MSNYVPDLNDSTTTTPTRTPATDLFEWKPTRSTSITTGPVVSSLCVNCVDNTLLCSGCNRLFCKYHSVSLQNSYQCIKCYTPQALAAETSPPTTTPDHRTADVQPPIITTTTVSDERIPSLGVPTDVNASGQSSTEAPEQTLSLLTPLIVPRRLELDTLITQEDDIPDIIVNYDIDNNYTDEHTGKLVNTVYPAVRDGRILHTIMGQHYHGLLLDPGASRGIMGTDMFQCLIQHVLEPYGKTRHIVWRDSQASFSGISATVQRSIAAITMPIGLAGMRHSVFQADLLGGAASWCPGLMPLRSLILAGALSAFGCFEGGDGIIAFRDASTQRMCPQRLYITDSGHYLLPIDAFDQPVDEALVDFMVKHFCYKLSRNPKGKGKPTHTGERSHSATTRSSNVFVVFDSHDDEVSQADSSFELVTNEINQAAENDTGTMDTTLADEVFP